MTDQAELQAKVQKLQTMGAQMQQLAQQRSRFEAMQSEAKRAIEALEGLADDATVYRNVGSLLVQDSGRDDAVARLKDELETLEIRTKRAKDQEAQMRTSLESLQKELQAAFGQ